MQTIYNFAIGLGFALIIQGVYAFRYAWRPGTKVFPYETFPDNSIIDNGDNSGKFQEEVVFFQEILAKNVSCIDVWVGNGACNRENNKPECNYDGGDCCRETCLKNCALKKQLNDSCKFECGSFRGYECKQKNLGCPLCNTQHGICRSQDQCLSDHSILGTADEVFQRLIDYCWSVDWSQGNYQTINLFCGKDPYKQLIHDIVYPDVHFEGCGMHPDICTAYPACDDLIQYKIGRGQSELQCTNQGKFKQKLYNISSGIRQETNETCYQYFKKVFFENYQFYGQCCQCREGWTGISCNQAVCYPNCQHGTCVEPNVCVCEPGWQGLLCQIGVCTRCDFGVCTAPETCDCFYGYEGQYCNITTSLPPCLHGKPDFPDHCLCEEGWMGRICDQPVCEPSCGNGHCISPNNCECQIGWESSSIDSLCDVKIPLTFDPNCIETYFDNTRCTKCANEYYLKAIYYDCDSDQGSKTLQEVYQLLDQDGNQKAIDDANQRCQNYPCDYFECVDFQCLDVGKSNEEWPYEYANCTDYKCLDAVCDNSTYEGQYPCTYLTCKPENCYCDQNKAADQSGCQGYDFNCFGGNQSCSNFSKCLKAECLDWKCKSNPCAETSEYKCKTMECREWKCVNFTCEKCSQIHDRMCFDCNQTHCLECQWPYVLDHETNQCYSGGVLEFSNRYLNVIEDQEFAFLYVRRSYGWNGTITVRYDMTQTPIKDTRIQKRSGTLVFQEEQQVATIQLDVFPRLQVESASETEFLHTEDTVFKVWLEYPSYSAEIGYQDYMVIHYFDSRELPDTRYTYVELLVGNNTGNIKIASDHLLGDKSVIYPNETRVKGGQPFLQANANYTFDIYAHYLYEVQKMGGEKPDTYYLVDKNSSRLLVREVLSSTYVLDSQGQETNHYQVTLHVKDLGNKFVHIFAGYKKGYYVRYHRNTNFKDEPFLERIENYLPVRLSDEPQRYWDKFAANYTFIVELNYEQTLKFPLEQDYTFEVQIAENAAAQIYLNDTLIIDIPYQHCHDQFYNGSQRVWSETDHIGSGTFNDFDTDYSSCCAQTYKHTRAVSGNIPFLFEIRYVQRQPARQGPCIKFTRESYNILKDSIDRDARAIVQLRDSPFMFQTVMSDEFVSGKYTTFHFISELNVNTGELVSQDDFQACVMNRFYVILRDYFDVEVVTLPEFQATFTFEWPNGTVQTEVSYLNETDKRKWLNVTYCGEVGTMNLRVKIKDNQDELTVSPRQFNVIPGPWNLLVSDFEEHNDQTNGCQAHTLCEAKIKLRDDYGNEIGLPHIFQENDMDFQLISLNQSQPTTKFKQIFREDEDTYDIFPLYIASQPGPHHLYIRIRGQKVKYYPIKIEVYSTVVSPTKSYILQNEYDDINWMRESSQNLIFVIQLCDQNGNKLSKSKDDDARYDITTTIEHQDGYTLQFSSEKITGQYYNETQDGQQLEIPSLYKITILTNKAGAYQMKIFVSTTEERYKVETHERYTLQNNVQLFTNILDHQFWQSYLAHPESSSAWGSAIPQVYTVSQEGFAVQILDQFQNLYNQTYWDQKYHLEGWDTKPTVELKTNVTNEYKDECANLPENQTCSRLEQIIPVREFSQDPKIGYYTYQFNISEYYDNLTLSIKVFTGEELKDIKGSPFTLTMVERDPLLFCESNDVFKAGYCITPFSKIIEQPASVVAGSEFTIKIKNLNVYKTNYIPYYDPIQWQYTLDYYFEESQECICSRSSMFCHHFSGSFDQCSKNKQCKWDHYAPTETQKAEKGHIFSCKPCASNCVLAPEYQSTSWNNSTEEQEAKDTQVQVYPWYQAREEVMFKNYQEQPTTSEEYPLPWYIPTNDVLYTYFTISIERATTTDKGHLTQVNVVEQGGFKLLMYETNQFSEFHSQIKIYDFSNIEFTSKFNPFFTSKRYMWSAVALGQYRFSLQNCTQLVKERSVHPLTTSEQNQVTFIVESDLRVELWIDNQLRLNKTTTWEQTEAKFEIGLEEMQLLLFEVRVAFDQPLVTKSRGFLRIFHQTFNTERQVLKPIHMFHFLPIEDTLTKYIKVEPAEPSPLFSEVHFTLCPIAPYRVPYITTITIVIRDKYKNLRLLQENDLLTIIITKNGEVDQTITRESLTEVNNNEQNIKFYQKEIMLTEAFATYFIEVQLNSEPIQFSQSTTSPNCTFTTLNQAVAPQYTSVEVIQIGKYWLNDSCVYANEISYIKLHLFDQFNNKVPEHDHDFYQNTLHFEFENGSHFSATQCQSFDEQGFNEEIHNVVICPIRPFKSGLEQLKGKTLEFPYRQIDVYEGILEDSFHYYSEEKSFDTQTIMVHSSLQKQIDLSNTDQFQLNQNVEQKSVQIKIIAQSPFGETITLQNSCSYFKHDRLVYWIDSIEPSYTGTSLTDGWLQLNFRFNQAPPKFVHFRLLDGVLMESGILVQYYSNDNLLGKPFQTLILQDTLNFQQVTGYDMYSVRATCYFKVPSIFDGENYKFFSRKHSTIALNGRVIKENASDRSSNQKFSQEIWYYLEFQARFGEQISGNPGIKVQIPSLNDIDDGKIEISNHLEQEDRNWQIAVPNKHAVVIDDRLTFDKFEALSDTN